MPLLIIFVFTAPISTTLPFSEYDFALKEYIYLKFYY